MSTFAFALLALFVLGFGLISGRLERSMITPPMAFVGFGILLGPLLGVIHIELESEGTRLLAELTLILVLFTDAARIDLQGLKHEYNLPVRLLSFGLPLMILFGTFLATWIFPELGFGEAAVLSTILAPTDAALGQAVVSSPNVPVRVRQALNVESGLNDGICLPFLLIFLSLADVEMTASGESLSFWVIFTLRQVILGPIVGAAVGYVGGWLLTRSSDREWVTTSFQDLGALSLSLLAFALAELVGGNGFIAAFCAGLALGNGFRAICSCLYEFGEAEGQLLILLTFTIYGAVMVAPALSALNLWIVLYGILSLTVLRILAVRLSLIPLQLQWETFLFLGWFGPRGVASVLYVLLILERSGLPHRELIFTVVIFTILISVFAHGLSAFPAAQAYATRLEPMKEEPDMIEHMPTMEMPMRLPYMDQAAHSHAGHH